MQKFAFLLLSLFTMILFAPSFLMIVNKSMGLTVLINEIEEEAKPEIEFAEKEFSFSENHYIVNHPILLVYHEYLNKKIFMYSRHFLEEEIPPPEFS